jgi:hypothetical protein
MILFTAAERGLEQPPSALITPVPFFFERERNTLDDEE